MKNWVDGDLYFIMNACTLCCVVMMKCNIYQPVHSSVTIPICPFSVVGPFCMHLIGLEWSRE